MVASCGLQVTSERKRSAKCKMKNEKCRVTSDECQIKLRVLRGECLLPTKNGKVQNAKWKV